MKIIVKGINVVVLTILIGMMFNVNTICVNANNYNKELKVSVINYKNKQDIETKDNDFFSNMEIVEEEETPKAFIDDANWAFMNLVFLLISLALSIYFIFTKQYRIEYDYTKEEIVEEKSKTMSYKITSICASIISLVTFVVTEDITKHMVLFDKWTIAMISLMLIQFALIVLSRKWEKDNIDEYIM